MPGVSQQPVFAYHLLLPRTFFIRLEPISLGNSRRSRVLENMIIACIDAGVAFDELRVYHLPIKVEDFPANIDALRTGITTVATPGTLRHTRDFLLYR